MAKENGIDEDLQFAVDTQSAIRDANETYDQSLAEILATLSLPLTECLGVAADKVDEKSREILEKIIVLRSQRDEALADVERKFEDYINRSPEAERDEVRAKLMILM